MIAAISDIFRSCGYFYVAKHMKKWSGGPFLSMVYV